VIIVKPKRGKMDFDNRQNASSVIEIRVEKVSRLFDTLDPLPFRQRDLDRHAEEFIVGWARELPWDQPIIVLVHLPSAEAATQAAEQLHESLKRYFDYRAEATTLELNELFRIGRWSLVVGITVLAVCLAIGQAVTGRLGPGYFGRFVEEGAIILGWVANWKPIEIFLYEWWPIIRRRNLYRRLALARVEVRPF
jgi:hypothetical protein